MDTKPVTAHLYYVNTPMPGDKALCGAVRESISRPGPQKGTRCPACARAHARFITRWAYACMTPPV